MPIADSRPERPSLAALASVSLLVAAVTMPSLAQQAADPAAEQRKWENLVQFFGEEETGDFSLRVFDKDVKERAAFRFLELWKYDREQKRWLKMDDRPQTSRIVMPNEKGPQDPPDTQLLASLPLTIQTPGVYFMKWRMNNTECFTLSRIGPHVLNRDPPKGPKPEKHIMMDVPIDLNKAERLWIPDPRFHTGQAAQGAPTTKPK